MKYKIGEIVNHKLIGKCIVVDYVDSTCYTIRLKDGSRLTKVDERELEEVMNIEVPPLIHVISAKEELNNWSDYMDRLNKDTSDYDYRLNCYLSQDIKRSQPSPCSCG